MEGKGAKILSAVVIFFFSGILAGSPTLPVDSQSSQQSVSNQLREERERKQQSTSCMMRIGEKYIDVAKF